MLLASGGAVPAAPVGTAAGQLFVATAPYNGDPTEHQLSFPAGAYLTARARRGEWYWGRVRGGGGHEEEEEEEGYFPPAYVRAVENPPPPPPPSPARPAPAAAAALAAKTKPSIDSRSNGAKAAKTTATRTIRHPRWSPPQRDGSDIAAGTAMPVTPPSSSPSSPSSSGGTRKKRSRPAASSLLDLVAAAGSAPASAPAVPAARTAETAASAGNTRTETDSVAACTLKPTSNTVRIPIPTAQANGTRFPPGCSVLHDQSQGTNGAGSVVMGFVHSVYLELSNPAFVPGSTYDVSYVVASEGRGTDSSLTDVTPTPEKELQYAPRCPVSVSPSFLPAPTKTVNGDKKTKKNDEYEDWARGTIVSSFQSFGGGADESYVVTLEGADGGMGGRVSGVPREMIRYRPPVPSTSTSPAHSAAPPSVKSKAKAAAPSSTPTVIDGSKQSTEEDISNESSSIMKRRASSSSEKWDNSNNNPVIVRRIDIPERIDFERVKFALVGPDHSINTQMMKTLHLDIYVIGHGLLLPKDAKNLHDLSSLLSAASNRSSSFVVLRGSHNKVSAAAKVIIHLLVDRAYQGGDQDGLKKELNSAPVLQTMVTPSVDDLASLDEAMAVGSSDDRKVGVKTEEGTIAPKVPVSKKKTNVASTQIKTVDESEGGTARIELPRWLEINHVKSLLTTDGLIEAILNASNCTISIENTATQGKETSVVILVHGLEKNSVDYASTLVTDILVESGVKETDIERRGMHIGGSSLSTSPHLTAGAESAPLLSASGATAYRGNESILESRMRVKAESEDEPKPKRSRIEPRDEADSGSNNGGEFECRLQYFPSWIEKDDINSQTIGREGEHKRDIERHTRCKFHVVDRRSIGKPVHMVVTNNCPDDKKRIIKATEYIEERVLKAIEDSQKGRFLYDMALCSGNDRDGNDKHPIVYQRSPRDMKRMVWMTIIDFPNCSNYSGFIIGAGGASVKHVRSKTGCCICVYPCTGKPGSNVFITGDDKESVMKAQQLVMHKIEEFSRIVEANIVAIVLEHAPLRLDQLKNIYSKKFGSSFDQKSFGYDQLTKFISSIQSIYMEVSSEDGRKPHFFLHHKLKPKGTEHQSAVELYVNNLDDTVTEDILRDEFATMGTVMSARVVRKKGISRDFGFVRYSTPEEATRAMHEMNGKMIGTKTISVAPSKITIKNKQPVVDETEESLEVAHKDARSKAQVALRAKRTEIHTHDKSV